MSNSNKRREELDKKIERVRAIEEKVDRYVGLGPFPSVAAATFELWSSSFDFFLDVQRMQADLAARTGAAYGDLLSSFSEHVKNELARPAKRKILADRITQLASLMWVEAGAHQQSTFLDYWGFAARQVHNLMEETIRAAEAVGGEAAMAAINFLDAFSPHLYRERIRQAAYSNWQARGEELWTHHLDDWVSAEQQVRSNWPTEKADSSS